ncbi:MAG: NAD(P)/FAD-dependent oxidoreductase [Proteobacteria bacterium]|nr:NAD(P)/FAD-dependent oxidoreductase [Pseudomonadota bacterium]
MMAYENYDALIVGARCAGAATAMLLARKGMRVLLVDRAGYGTDTVSTHALMRGAVLQLHRWGVLPHLLEAGTPPVRSTTFHYGDEKLTVAIKPANGMDALYAPRRALLDSTLVDAAWDAGVQVRHGQTLVRLSRRADGRVCGGTLLDAAGDVTHVTADLVIGADGAGSTVARLVGAETLREARHTTAVLYGYFGGREPDGYEWWYRPGVAAGAIPTNRGHHCVFVAMTPDRLHGVTSAGRAALFSKLVQEADPALAAQLAGRTPDAPLRMFGGRKGFLRQASGPGWALVGDAGYFRDPITAHGITDALRDAELLARAVVTGRPEEYATVRNELSLPLFDVTDAIAAFDWSVEEVQALHRALNQAMKREVEHLISLETTPVIEEVLL